MKFAVISDIHANHRYLERALDFTRSVRADRVYCLGDLVGYYDDPGGVIELLKRDGVTALKGNHEKYLLEEAEYPADREHLYGIERQRRTLNPRQINYLRSLKDNVELKVNDGTTIMTHSMIDDAFGYCYDWNRLAERVQDRCDRFVTGHTHLPGIVHSLGVEIVNPGSIGQPRDYSRQASCAVVDTDLKTTSIVKIDVPVENYVRKLRDEDFPSELTDILTREKKRDHE